MASRSFVASATISMTGGGCGAECGVARAPVLRALVSASGAASLATAPELKIGEGRLRLAGLGDQLNEDRNKTKNTYPDRALMLRLPVQLLRACGTETPPED